MARLHIRLNDEADRDIIAWLEAQCSRTEAVKGAIRLAMADVPSAESVAIDLGTIRAVFEAVLGERLGEFMATGTQRLPETKDLDAAARLDSMF